MSYIKIDLKTEKTTGDISIGIKTNCTLNELEVATGTLMGALATKSTTGVEVIKSLLKDIEEATDEII